RVKARGGVVAKARDQRAYPRGFLVARQRIREHHVLVDLAERERLREARDGGCGLLCHASSNESVASRGMRIPYEAGNAPTRSKRRGEPVAARRDYQRTLRIAL